MTVRCGCGSVEFDVIGAPVAGVACYCDDCQQGSRQIEALPSARAVLGPDGGTEYLLYRKDRVTCSKGAGLLKDYKIREKSKSRRVVATCCNAGMFLGFEDSRHWVSMYRARFGENAPPIEMRICTKFKPANSALRSDVPSYPGFSLRFIGKLLGARIAMLLGR